MRFATSTLVLAALCVALAVNLQQVNASKDHSNGWGDSINWHPSLADAVEASKHSGKPIMTVISKSWCGACKNLKPKFAESKEIAEESKNFEMYNALDNDEPQGSLWAPDGGYIPRILFNLAGSATPDAELALKAKGQQYRYYYSAPSDIVAGMKQVLAQAGSSDEL